MSKFFLILLIVCSVFDPLWKGKLERGFGMCLSFVCVLVSILRIFRSMIKISVIIFGTLI